MVNHTGDTSTKIPKWVDSDTYLWTFNSGPRMLEHFVAWNPRHKLGTRLTPANYSHSLMPAALCLQYLGLHWHQSQGFELQQTKRGRLQEASESVMSLLSLHWCCDASHIELYKLSNWTPLNETAQSRRSLCGLLEKEPQKNDLTNCLVEQEQIGANNPRQLETPTLGTTTWRHWLVNGPGSDIANGLEKASWKPETTTRNWRSCDSKTSGRDLQNFHNVTKHYHYHPQSLKGRQKERRTWRHFGDKLSIL